MNSSGIKKIIFSFAKFLKFYLLLVLNFYNYYKIKNMQVFNFQLWCLNRP